MRDRVGACPVASSRHISAEMDASVGVRTTTLTCEHEELRKYLKTQHNLWLPVSFPSCHQSKLPLDVLLWLFELRHRVHCGEVQTLTELTETPLSGSRQSTDVVADISPALSEYDEGNEDWMLCDENFVAHPANSGVGYAAEEHNKRLMMMGEEERRKCGHNNVGEPLPSDSSSDSGSSGIQDDTGFVLYRIPSLERGIYCIQEETSDFSDGEDVAAESEPTRISSMAQEECDSVLRHLEEIIEQLDETGILSSDAASTSAPVPDGEFLVLCEEADNLAEETLQEHYDAAPPTRKPVEPSTTSSELSDDVFLAAPLSESDYPVFRTEEVTSTAEKPHFAAVDINSIFDNGIHPPVPPERKKKQTKRQVSQEAVALQQGSDVTGEETCFLESQELLMLTRVTDCSKEKRKQSTSSDHVDEGGCPPDGVSERKTRPVPALELLVSDSLPEPAQMSPASLDRAISSLEMASASLSLELSDDTPVQTKLRPIASVEFPPRDDDSPCPSLERSRKGSAGSDVAAWKSGLHPDDEWDPDCMQSDEWFSSLDEEGRVYFFEENSNESSWTLPEAHPPAPEPPAVPELTLRGHVDRQRIAKSLSMLAGDLKPREISAKSTSMPRNIVDFDGSILGERVLLEAVMNRTKLWQDGKKQRKSWSSGRAVLTERRLLLLRPAGALEMSLELRGATVRADDGATRRRHALLVTSGGSAVLLQCAGASELDQWLGALLDAIKACPNETRLERSASVKVRSKEGSLEDLASSLEERQTKIRQTKARLKKFFIRRPTKELLVRKGIYKDEPVFGRLLADVCGSESPKVPRFVRRCVEAIESREDNLRADGLYRASGNLSQVQRLRLRADQNDLSALELEEDVHVLAGALKLFFRELQQPLISFQFFGRALRASTNPNKKEKIQEFRTIGKSLPTPNHDTLEFLLRHLLKVTSYHEHNRMHISNLAIVFGPTLMWPEAESANMAFDLMQQNLVIECLLQEFDSIFR